MIYPVGHVLGVSGLVPLWVLVPGTGSTGTGSTGHCVNYTTTIGVSIMSNGTLNKCATLVLSIS